MRMEVIGLHKSFGDKKVLKGLHLSAESGKALGILGRNGAGKTTIIRILMGVFNGDSGEILIDGLPIRRNKLSIGYLPEERGMYAKRLVLEQLVYFGSLKGMSQKSAIESADYWLERLGMSEHRHKKLDTLSKGNQQKIQLVATLISNPEIIILDEPFSGLDPVNAALLKDIVKELIGQDKIVLFSSHQMNYIEEFCDEIVILNDGEIVLSGNITHIKRNYDRCKIIVSSNDSNLLNEKLHYKTKIEKGLLVVNLEKEEDKHHLITVISSITKDIDMIKVFEPSLEDIFIEYTEGKIV